MLRVLDSLQHTMYQKVATPANWVNGGECMVLPSVSKDEAAKLFPKHRTAEVRTKLYYQNVEYNTNISGCLVDR